MGSAGQAEVLLAGRQLQVELDVAAVEDALRIAAGAVPAHAVLRGVAVADRPVAARLGGVAVDEHLDDRDLAVGRQQLLDRAAYRLDRLVGVEPLGQDDLRLQPLAGALVDARLRRNREGGRTLRRRRLGADLYRGGLRGRLRGRPRWRLATAGGDGQQHEGEHGRRRPHTSRDYDAAAGRRRPGAAGRAPGGGTVYCRRAFPRGGGNPSMPSIARPLTRRRLLVLAGGLGLTAVAAACAAPAAPTNTPEPAKPAAAPPTNTAAPAKPTEAPKPAEPTKPAAAAPTNTAAPAATKPAEPTKPNVQAAAPAKAASGAPVEISIATSWTGTGEKKVWDQLIEGFNKKYPNIKIKLDLSSAEGEYDQKLFAQLAAGTLPDVVLTSDNHVVPFKQNKVTRDMIPFAQKTNFPYQDFDKSFLDLGMVEGELHMLPRGGDVVVLFINKKMVKDAGVDIPWKLDPTSNNWTKEDFAQVVQRLTVDSKGKRGNEAGFDKNNVAVYGA